MVGGVSKTISPGGFILGGGHSPVTGALGFAVDSVIRLKIVVANGDHLEVNYAKHSKCTNISFPPGRER